MLFRSRNAPAAGASWNHLARNHADTNTVHIPITIANWLTPEQAHSAATHELTHAIQYFGGSSHPMKTTMHRGKTRKGTSYDPYTSRPVAKNQRKTAGKMSDADRIWWSYLGSGHETQARITGHLPKIISDVEEHHAKNRSEEKIKTAVADIQKQNSKIKSYDAKKYHAKTEYTKLFNTIASEYKSQIPKDVDTRLGGSDTYSIGQGMASSGKKPKPVQLRHERLSDLQDKNYHLLSKQVHDRYLNNLIHKHSGFDVLAHGPAEDIGRVDHTQKRTEALRSKAERKQGKKTEKPAKVEQPEVQAPAPSKKKSLLGKLRSIFTNS